jgi:hypothetical protein
MLNRFAPLCLAACLWVGCNSAADNANATGATGDKVTAPCAVFTEEMASVLGNGPYKAGEPTVDGPVSLCVRGGDVSAPIHGATARFERMTKDQFLAQACKTPIDPETKAPLYEVDILTGLHEAACRFKPFGEQYVGIQVLTRSGWAILVGSAPEEKCLAAIEAMIPKLPK